MSKLSIANLLKMLPLWLLVLMVPLIKSTELLDQGLLSRFLSLQVVLFLLLVMRFLSKRKIVFPLRSPLLLIVLLFVLYTGFHLFWGKVYSDSVFDWIKTSSYFLLLLLLINLYSFDELKSGLTGSLAVLSIVLATWGAMELFQVVQTGKLSIPLSTYQIKTAFGHRNLYLQILFLTYPFQLYHLFSTTSHFKKYLLTIFSGITLFLLIVLSNRTVWLALVLGFGWVIFLEYRRRKQRKSPVFIDRKRQKIFHSSLLLVLLFSGLFFATCTKTPEAEEHFSNILKPEMGSGKDRLELWKRTLKIIKAKPLLGCGAANWKIDMMQYGNKGLVSENNITFYQRPHNDFLWVFAEQGLIGGLLYLSLFVLIFYLLLQRGREKNPKALLFQMSLLFAFTGFTLFSFFSFPHERVVHNILLTLLLSVIVAQHINEKKPFSLQSKLQKTLFYGASTLLLSIAILFGYQRFVSEVHTRNALLAKQNKQNLVVIKEIIKAATPYYQMDPLSTPLGWYEGLAWYNTGETDSALKYFSMAYALNPYHVHVLNDLATVYAQKGETAKAVQLYKKVLTIYPAFDESALNLCAVYYNTGEIDSAYSILKTLPVTSKNPKYKSFLKAVLKAKNSLNK